MEHFKRLGVTLLILCALPTVAQQDEGAAFFSVSSDRTFAPPDTPTVRLWGQGIHTLQFRLYKVNDPVAFFRKLDDDHNFGDRTERQVREATPLEKFRAWKNSWRRRGLRLMRAQFTLESRIAYRDWRLAREHRAVKGAKAAVQNYANVPVLNPQQLVASWEQPFSTANRWESAQVPVPAPGKGLYLVEATNGKLQAYTIVSVSEIALITKAAPGRILARVVRRDTGVPVAGCTISIYGKDKKTSYGDGRTNAQGMFEAPVKQEKIETALVLARQGDDFTAVSMYGGNLTSEEDRNLRGYAYTDRPVYRPGHTVKYKGIFRARTGAGYALPAGREVSVEVNDDDGQTIHKSRLALSAMGTVNGEFTIPAAGGLGFYNILMKLGESYHTAAFRVEEYRKPEYEVRVTPQVKRVIQGATIPVEVRARYFYGEPVANAKVVYVVHRSRYWLPFSMEEQGEEQGEGDDRWQQREQASEQQAALDADGKLVVQIPTAQAQRDERYRIEARVTDAAGREIAGAGSAVATVGPYFVRIRSRQYVYGINDKAHFEIETRDYDGNPVGGRSFEVELVEWRWREGRGAKVSAAQGTTDAQGTARVEMALRGGTLKAFVKSRTDEGRFVEVDQYVWVTGGGAWTSVQGERIQIVPDRKSYQPGEKARVLIVAGEPGANLWVTAQGRSVHVSRTVSFPDGTATVEIPIERGMVPNFFVTAVTVRGNKLVQGSVSIQVPPVEQTLAVDLKPAKAEYKPGEPATYSIEARDSSGKPVAGEFSIGVVDEAIYAVRPEGAQDIVQAFYGRDYDHISMDTSLAYYFHGEAGRRRMPLARIRPFRAQAQLKPENPQQPRVRRAFPDTALWLADVKTGADGRAAVRLEYPDALTTWRATARGVTLDTKVGSAVNRVVVRKNLLIRLSTPRFFRLGDAMTITAIAQNFLASEKKVRVSLEAKGVDVVEGAAQEITVPSRGTGTVDYRVRVPAGREAVLLAKAITDEESDALELTIPVIPYGVRVSDARGGSFAGSAAQAEATVELPADAELSSGALEISVAPSAVTSLFDALEYLTSFPYGCTEQTMSSFGPNVVVSQAIKSLGVKSNVDEAKLKKQIRGGLERLAVLQHSDGGWGWWENDESSAFMTAYVVAGLKQAEAAKAPASGEMMDRGAGWLKKWRPRSKDPAELQAYVAYALALAGSGDRQRVDALFGERARLSSHALVLVGLALREMKDSRADDVAAMVEQQAKTTEMEAWWPSDKDDLLDIHVDNTPEATAYAVKLLAQARPQSALLPKAAVYLVNHRAGGFCWNSTKQTAMVLYGLTDYLKQSGELNPNMSVTVFVNDKPVLTKRFAENEAAAPAMVRLGAAAANRVRVVRNGEGRVYWSVRADYYSQAPKGARQNAQLKLEREVYKLTAASTGAKVVYQLQPLQGAAAPGDVLAVRLRLAGDAWRYLMMEDPIPAGTEFIERDDLYEIAEKPPWWRTWYTRREFRDDRAVFFRTFFDRGNADYFYLLKVVNPGQFRVSPARVEPMYQPGTVATSEPGSLEVRR